MKPTIDLLSQVCIYTDFPFWREWIKKYRSNFNKVILYASKQHGVVDLETYWRDVLPETWVSTKIDWTTPGIDWRQAESEPLLEKSESKWILFMEADFFCDDWDKLWTDVEKAMETADLIGWWSASAFPYIHPCFCLIKRELLDKTNKDFRAHPEIDGSDHFAMITKDAEALGAKIVKLQDLGWTEPDHAFHLGGLTYPFQDFKGDETIIGTKYPAAFATYVDTLIAEWETDSRFLKLAMEMAIVLRNKGIERDSKWFKFFQL